MTIGTKIGENACQALGNTHGAWGYLVNIETSAENDLIDAFNTYTWIGVNDLGTEYIRRLREKKVITGYAALIDPAKVGRGLMIFVEVLLDRTTGDMFEAFAEAVRRQPEVLECHMVAGGFDYLIKARVGDMDAYRAFLGDVLVKMPGVRETRTYAVLEEVKSTTVLPL